MKFITVFILFFITFSVYAKGGSGHSSLNSRGTGAKSQHVHVRGYTKKDGTHIAPYQKSTPDKTKNNNWSTTGNTNPVTGKAGTKPVDQ